MLVLDLHAVGVDAGEALLLHDAVVARIAKHPTLEVISSDEMNKLVAVEADKQHAGCDPTSSSACLAEIAGALGAEYIVVGNVGKLGERVVLNLTLLEGGKAEAKARASAGGKSIDELVSDLGPAVDELMSTLAPTPKAAVDPLFVTGAAVGVVGVVGVVVGAVWVGALEATLGTKQGGAGDKQKALDTRFYALGTLGAGVVVSAVGAALVVATWGE